VHLLPGEGGVVAAVDLDPALGLLEGVQDAVEHLELLRVALRGEADRHRRRRLGGALGAPRAAGLASGEHAGRQRPGGESSYHGTALHG
jgi:hypothetical protein